MKRRVFHIVFLSLVVVTAVYAKSAAKPTRNPFQDSPIARAAGQKLFLRHCAECHGTAGEGTDRAPSLQEFARSAAPASLQAFIKNGNLRAGMPSWSRLPDAQLWQLVTYLQTLER